MNELNIEMIKKAYERIYQYIRKTPLIHSEVFSKLCSGNVYLKLENLQVTNSFKIRGALNRMSLLSTEEKALGVITASSGNHAQGVA
ncbi:MAG: pyridoxal-phosphate dependent enzyme, partial [Candidatus Thorarchaeota archaeon]